MHGVKLRGYQEVGKLFLLNRKRGMLADDMGLGKTLQTIAAAEIKNVYPWVIVCPQSVRNQWKKVIQSVTDDFTFVQVIETGKDKLKPNHVYIVSYGLIKVINKQLSKIEILILDEAHYCKNIEANRTREVYSKDGLRGKANTIWALTGTPIYNRPIDLYTHLAFLYPRALVKAPTYEDFARRYNRAWWPKGNKGIRFGKAQNTDELKDLMKGFILRRLKTEVEKELPDISINLIDADICNPARLKELQDKYERTKNQDSKRDLMKDPRGERAKLRREYALLKVDFSISYAVNELEKYEKIVIFTYHTSVSEALRIGLRKYNPVVYDGKITPKQKDEALEVFKKGNSRVFIGQVGAAGTGLDGLQHVCHRGIFVEWDHTPGAVNQTIDRLFRIGQEKGVMITFIAIPNSIESDMINSLSSKKQDSKKIIG